MRYLTICLLCIITLVVLSGCSDPETKSPPSEDCVIDMVSCIGGAIQNWTGTETEIIAIVSHAEETHTGVVISKNTIDTNGAFTLKLPELRDELLFTAEKTEPVDDSEHCTGAIHQEPESFLYNTVRFGTLDTSGFPDEEVRLASRSNAHTIDVTYLYSDRSVVKTGKETCVYTDGSKMIFEMDATFSPGWNTRIVEVREISERETHITVSTGPILSDISWRLGSPEFTSSEIAY